MLTGWPPFYDKNLRKMCEQILKSDLAFPPACAASPEARDFIRNLLMRDPAARLGARAGGVEELKRHPFFRGLDWEALERRELEAPFKPAVSSDTDITNFDTTFTSEKAQLTPPLPTSELVSRGRGGGGGRQQSRPAEAIGHQQGVPAAPHAHPPSAGMRGTPCCYVSRASATTASPTGTPPSPRTAATRRPVHAQSAAEAADEFSDFGFVDLTRLKSSLMSMLGVGAKGGAAGKAGGEGDEDDEVPTSTGAGLGVAEGTGGAAGSSGAGGEGSDRVDHRDAPVTPELLAHLQRVADGVATPVGATAAGGAGR